MTIKEFADSEGLNPRTLSWWRWKVRQDGGDAGTMSFTELTLQEEEPTVVLALDGLDAHIVVDRCTDLELLRDVLVALS